MLKEKSSDNNKFIKFVKPLDNIEGNFQVEFQFNLVRKFQIFLTEKKNYFIPR